MSVAIPIRRGATLVLPLDFFTDEAETTPVDLTGSTLTVVQSNFPVDPNLVVLDADSGSTRLSLAATDTDNLVLHRNYVLTIKQVQPSSNVVLHGPFTFTATDA
jgi:hypothetical protein